MNDLHRKMYMVISNKGVVEVTSEEMRKHIMMTYQHRKTFIVVPDADAEEVSALGAIRVTSDEMKKHKMFRYMRLKPDVSLWYYNVDKDPDLFVKWPVVVFGVMPPRNNYYYDSKNVALRLDDDRFEIHCRENE